MPAKEILIEAMYSVEHLLKEDAIILSFRRGTKVLTITLLDDLAVNEELENKQDGKRIDLDEYDDDGNYVSFFDSFVKLMKDDEDANTN